MHLLQPVMLNLSPKNPQNMQFNKYVHPNKGKQNDGDVKYKNNKKRAISKMD